MHPEVLEAAPGKCPICGMTLVARKPGAARSSAEAEDLEEAPITIDPVLVQKIGVVSVPAKVTDLPRVSRTVGILDFNAERISWINIKFEGWIEKVHVSYIGQEVRKGQRLFEIYSPELVTTQEEYLRALQYRRSLEHSAREATRRQAEDLVAATRERLRYWDIGPEQIRRIEETGRVQRRIAVPSPADGIVAEVLKDALEGMYVRPGMNLYKIVDLSTLWVHADVYEDDLPWVRRADPAEVSFRNEPGTSYRGRVLFLYPKVSPETRTLKICVEIPNPGGGLRPGMYADVRIQGPPVPDAVVIPESAVLRSGERDLVFLDRGNGRFEPREVSLGLHGTGERVQVLEGVAPGDPVVVQARFMLDSESSVQEAIAKFEEHGTGS
jgi:Cu(I)/Ag(I) efflux system membrane fusion protein/cobalt-zinc-cadmium efflux system membrane fusion protein